jgi:tRNA A37 methylthiotransferase MiaB
MSLKVSLVQPNFQQGPSWMNIYFLPYSVACVWAQIASDRTLGKLYRLDQIVWRRDPIDSLAEQLADNHLVMFSTYIWNRNYNYALAARIKKINPNVIIIFGGPEPDYTDIDFFKKHPYIDFVIKREGELVIVDLLNSLNSVNKDVKQVPGLLVNDRQNRVDTGDAERINDLSILPSPYLIGIFDRLITAHPEVSWNASLETNRGCPFQCTFCDWGSLTYSKVRQFPLERVFAEIEWLAPRVAGIYCADANFGMFIERDSKIVDKILEVNQIWPNMSYIYFNWAKNQKNEVIDLVKRLSTQSTLLNNGLTVSTQSMTPQVLDIIKRTNLKQHRIQEIYELAHIHDVMTYTELILGLPGETQESFQNSVFSIIESDLHHSIEINQCQLLSNAEMNTVQKEIYNIQTVEMIDYVSMHQDVTSEHIETVATTVSTNTMSFMDILETNAWLSFMTLMHFYGFSTQIARFARRYDNMRYQDFYKKLHTHALNDSYFKYCNDQTTEQFTDWLTYGYLPRPLITQIIFNGYNILGSFILLVQTENKIDYVFDFLTKFIDCEFSWDDKLKQELMRYQRAITYTHQKENLTERFDYDFLNYLNNDAKLDVPCVLNFSSRPIHQNLSFNQFLENVFYKRRQRFGLMSVDYAH